MTNVRMQCLVEKVVDMAKLGRFGTIGDVSILMNIMARLCSMYRYQRHVQGVNASIVARARGQVAVE